jgi:5-formyltetrahydrofolate cyclo-ligase
MVSAAPSAPAAPTGAALYEAKRALRERILRERDALPLARRVELGERIAAGVAALPSFANARIVLITLPFRSEWNSRPLIEAALARGKTVAAPRVDGQTRMLELHAILDLSKDVVPGYQGIPEPLPALPRIAPETVDWALVPGVAFDRTGGRVGYGGGFYDRLLPLLPGNAARVAGAFDLQMVDRVPAAIHDLRVSTIVTPTTTVTVAARP